MAASKVEVGRWVVDVGEDGGAYAFDPTDVLDESRPAIEGARAAAVTACVEVHRLSDGGMMPWALVGGSFTPGAGAALRLEVAHSGALTLGPALDCVGLSGRKLSRGLPLEFAESTLDGMVRFDELPVMSGVIEVGSGAYHEADSNGIAFELAGGLLSLILLVRARGREVEAADLRPVRSAWASR